MTEYFLKNQRFILGADTRGAAISRLFYKPLSRELAPIVSNRDTPNHYFGTVVGPVANRISGGRIAMNGQTYELDKNEGENTLHGGRVGLSELDWQVVSVEDDAIRLELSTKALHMGFPGPSQFICEYRLFDDGFSVQLQARSKVDNVFNLAPHIYLNLDGEGDVNAHRLQIQADEYLPTDDANIPLSPQIVENTRFDFRKMDMIGTRALDHNFCLSGHTPAATLMGASGLTMTLRTNQLGLQIYDGRHIERRYLAIEPQGWPNAVNSSKFPSQFVKAGEEYRSVSSFLFSKRGD